MSPEKSRLTTGAVSGLLFLWMLWNLLSGPTLDFEAGSDDTPAFEVACEPLSLQLSWVDDIHASAIDGYRKTYDVTEGPVPRSDAFQREWERLHPDEEFDPAKTQDWVDHEVLAELNTRCDGARSAQAATMALVAVPASVLAVIGLGIGRRRPDAQGPPAAPPSGASAGDGAADDDGR